MKLEVGNHTKYEITDCTGLEYRNNEKREWEGGMTWISFLTMKENFYIEFISPFEDELVTFDNTIFSARLNA